MRAHQLIRQARKRAGLSQDEAAGRVGLSFNNYFDVELYDDEFVTVLAVSQARVLCRQLGLRLAEVLASEPLEADLSSQLPPDLAGLPRHALLRKRRESLGMSIEEVAFAIGFEEVAVDYIETDDNYLDTLSITVVAEPSIKLNLPLLPLLRSPDGG